jgi:hypothetical protein
MGAPSRPGPWRSTLMRRSSMLTLFIFKYASSQDFLLANSIKA